MKSLTYKSQGNLLDSSSIATSDYTIDQRLPEDLRLFSTQHWTPLHVASLAARWLEEVGAKTVLDLGSGVGKFCVIGASLTSGRYLGVEQRGRMVEIARQLARDFGVEERVEFIHGRIGEAALPPVDAYYLYNPFGENFAEEGDQIADDVELSPERFVRDIRVLKNLLAEVPAGRHVVTYHGFGGYMPPGYEEVRFSLTMYGDLRMWRRSGNESNSPPPRAG